MKCDRIHFRPTLGDGVKKLVEISCKDNKSGIFLLFASMELRTFRQNPPWAEEEGSVWGNQRKIDTGVTPIRNSLRRSKMLCLIKVNMKTEQLLF